MHVKGEDLDVVLQAPAGAEKAGMDPSSEMIDRRPDVDRPVKVYRQLHGKPTNGEE